MFKNVKKEEVTIPAQMSYLIQVRDFIEHIGKKYKYSEKLVNSFKLVIDEACTNIIRHGYRDIKNGEIQIKAIIRRLSLTIIIIDQGTSYDPRQANSPDLAKYVDIGKKGGLGILMMRKLMDDLQYSVTERGNEFRLTKYRETTDESKTKQFWHSLNLRFKYSLITALIVTAIVGSIFSILFVNLEVDTHDEIMRIARAGTRSLADNSLDDFVNYRPPLLVEKAVITQRNNPSIIKEAFVVDSSGKIEARSNWNQISGNYKIPSNAKTIDTTDGVIVYKYSLNDTLPVYDFMSDIRLPSATPGKGTVLGYAHVQVAQYTFAEVITHRRINLIIIMLVLLAAGYIGSFFLVSQILKSFHSLADWVRQVVHGKVDQDEIDIDASDEIGEIAQAFNEMTEKFRQAQVNLMEQQKLQKELQVAQEIQQMLLPNDFPKVEGFDIGSYYEAAKEVGGDLFDFVEVDDDTVGIIVADVSGKGVPGSLIMTMIRTAIRLESRGNKNPADVLARVNRFVTDDMKRGMFVTMFYVVLDSRNRVIHYASAGHNPMILFRSSAKHTYYLNPSGFPVGIQLPDIQLFEQKIKTDSIRLREDDILVLYTDGITEAMNHKRELYREERFLQAIRDNGHLDVAEFVKSIKDNLKKFTGGAPQNDDITFVAIKEKMMPGEIIYKTHQALIQLISEGVRVKDACDKLNVSQYRYYKYKNIIEEGGLDALRDFLDGQDYLEKKHLSIEVKAKIFDIIRQNAKLGAKSISQQLKTEKYGSLEIDEHRIYNELVKLRLNTYPLRKRFVEKGQNKRLKQPGTPLLTLDGKVILDFESSEKEVSKRTGFKGNVPSQAEGQETQEKKPFIRVIDSSNSERKSQPKMMHQTGKAFEPTVKEETTEPIEEKPVAEKPKKTKSATPSPVVPSRADLEARAAEKADTGLINSYYESCKDDFNALSVIEEKMDVGNNAHENIRKSKIILKIASNNPILKKLPEFKQLVSQAFTTVNFADENYSDNSADVLVEKTRIVLNYLRKENILSSKKTITERVNELGLLHQQLEKSLSQNPKQKDKFSQLRNKIAQKKLVNNENLLQSLTGNPKS